MSSLPEPPRTPPPCLETAAMLQLHALGLHDREKTPRYKRSTSPSPWRPRVPLPPVSSRALQQALGIHLQGSGSPTPSPRDSITTRESKRSPEHRQDGHNDVFGIDCHAPSSTSRGRSATMRRASAQAAGLEPLRSGFVTTFATTPPPPNGFSARMAERSSRTTPPLPLFSDRRQVQQSSIDVEALEAGLQSAFTPTSASMASRQQQMSSQRSTRTRSSPYWTNGASAAGAASNPCTPLKLSTSYIRRGPLSHSPTSRSDAELPPRPPQHGLALDIFDADVVEWSGQNGQMTPPLANGSSCTSVPSLYRLPPANDNDSDSSSELEEGPISDFNLREFTVSSETMVASTASAPYLKAYHQSNQALLLTPSSSSSSPSTSTSSFSSSIPSSASGWGTDSAASNGTSSPFI
ncbi:hypothetical protein CF326_g2176 [Tilletia indica]|nr:hypothetical protein CF326_g2176 [Tilletia indica]